MKVSLKFAIFAMICCWQTAPGWAAGRLELRAVDKETGEPLAARVHLLSGQGKPYRPSKMKGGIASGDYIVFGDKLVLDLPNGRYSFVMEHGPEYRVMSGHFDIQNFADDSKTIELTRFCDMAKEGWFSADLDVQRQEVELKQLMQAEDLHVTPLITWTNTKNIWEKRPLPKQVVNQFGDSYVYSLMGGQWKLSGNTLGLFRLEQPIELPADFVKAVGSDKKLSDKKLDPIGSLPLIPLIESVRTEQRGWIDAGAPFARDLPIWIAAGVVDSIQVLNSHVQRQSTIANEAGGWPRDLTLFPGSHGNGRWSQEVYYHLLNCGLRIPPTAGSGSGTNNNPVGYNRVYAYLGKSSEDDSPSKLTWDGWWDALRSGRVSITNGPLLRTEVEGEPPGHVFRGDAGQTLELAIALTLSTRDKIRYLDVVKNGRTEISVSLDEFKKAGAKLPPLKFTESGWFVIRAVTDVVPTYRYASTGPYFVDIGYQPRISRKSAQFFQDWTNKRGEEIVKDNNAAAESVKQSIAKAQQYWQALLEKATAD